MPDITSARTKLTCTASCSANSHVMPLPWPQQRNCRRMPISSAFSTAHCTWPLGSPVAGAQSLLRQACGTITGGWHDTTGAPTAGRRLAQLGDGNAAELCLQGTPCS